MSGKCKYSRQPYQTTPPSVGSNRNAHTFQMPLVYVSTPVEIVHCATVGVSHKEECQRPCKHEHQTTCPVSHCPMVGSDVHNSLASTESQSRYG